MDIINKLQAYKEELLELSGKLEYHRASQVSLLIDKIDTLIKDIIEFENPF